MRMPLFAGCNLSFRNSLGVLFIFYHHSYLTIHISLSHFPHLFVPLLWEISTECLTTWWKVFWGFPCHSGTLSERTSEVLIIFHCPDTVSFHSPTHRGTHINTFMKLMYFYMFSRKMIFQSLPLIFFDKSFMQKLAWQTQEWISLFQ